MLFIHDGQSQAVELNTLTDEGMRSYYYVYASISHARSDLYKEESSCQVVTSTSHVAKQVHELSEGKHCATMCPSGQSKVYACARTALACKNGRTCMYTELGAYPGHSQV